MKLKAFPIIFAIAFLSTLPIFDITSVSSVYGSVEAVEPTGNTTNSKFLEITDHSYTEGPLFTLVNGTVLNNSSSRINSATIHVEYYYSNNSLITIGSSTVDFPILNPKFYISD
jgi:hypothetical protein